MKKKIFFIVCFFVALSTSSVMANNNLNNESVSNITYSIDLGDISGMSVMEVSDLFDNAFTSVDAEMATQELQCKVTVEVNVGIFKVTVEISGPCSEVKDKAKQVVKELVDEFK